MLKIGHRGAPFQAPENTLGSFKKAMALGADGVELDVHLCKSGEVVVIHDDRVDRTTQGIGAVSDLTLAQLRNIPILGGEHIPTLAETLDALGSEARFFIEIKAPEAALPAADLVRDYIRQGWPAERLYIISFDHEALRLIAGNFTDIYTGASFEELQEHSVEEAQSIGAHAIIPHYLTLDVPHIGEAHRLGMSVITWTVNNAEDIAQLAAMRVDGIISDYPERL